MKKSFRNSAKLRYNEDGLRVGREKPHSEKLAEKRLRSELHSKSFAVVEQEDDDLDPHWLYREDD